MADRRLGRRSEGWLRLEAGRGRCARPGWFHGLKVFDAIAPRGTITGLALAPPAVQEPPCTRKRVHFFPWRL